jgi:hypothetical protein
LMLMHELSEDELSLEDVEENNKMWDWTTFLLHKFSFRFTWKRVKGRAEWLYILHFYSIHEIPN